jgi:hypothetical protein
VRWNIIAVRRVCFRRGCLHHGIREAEREYEKEYMKTIPFTIASKKKKT